MCILSKIVSIDGTVAGRDRKIAIWSVHGVRNLKIKFGSVQYYEICNVKLKILDNRGGLRSQKLTKLTIRQINAVWNTARRRGGERKQHFGRENTLVFCTNSGLRQKHRQAVKLLTMTVKQTNKQTLYRPQCLLCFSAMEPP